MTRFLLNIFLILFLMYMLIVDPFRNFDVDVRVLIKTLCLLLAIYSVKNVCNRLYE
jgi:hypothetical protein